MPRKSEFPKYVPGNSCIKQGKEHKFQARESGKGAICVRCGSSISQGAWEKRNSKKEK